MDIKEELKSAGVYPTGPCSAWPQDRNQELVKRLTLQGKWEYEVGGERVTPEQVTENKRKKHATEVKVGLGEMAKGLANTAKQALVHGRVEQEIRDERYEMCKACPAFIEDSKRCSECGCFMEAKTWIGGDPEVLCPLKKWVR